jgi:hypothetical protein
VTVRVRVSVPSSLSVAVPCAHDET